MLHQTAVGRHPSQLYYRRTTELQVVEKIIVQLYHQVINQENPSTAAQNKCITIPRRLLITPTTSGYVHGQVWRWFHVAFPPEGRPLYSRMDVYRAMEFLEPNGRCRTCRLFDEICLNPNHYEGTAEELEAVALPWGTITYYEKDMRIDENFLCEGDIIQIKCTDENPLRPFFNVKELTNSHRTPLTTFTRSVMGHGVRLLYCHSQVFIEIHSECNVFVHSGFHNKYYELPPQNICELSMQGCMKNVRIMCDDTFHKMLEEEVPKGAEAVYEISKICTIRICFIKEWNQLFPITNSGCWFEVRLVKHLRWLQKTLTDMEAPYKIHF